VKGVIVGGICIDYDPQGPHREGENECNWWHGGVCDCRPEMVAASAREHCHECNFVNAYDGATPCNCLGRCICDREEDCPCPGRGIEPVVRLSE
jgi:hypothetical protein